MEEVTLDAGLSRDCPEAATKLADCTLASGLADAAGLSYEWNMDDRGVILSGRVIKYQFPRRGDYQVTLTVINARGVRSDATRHPIDVAARP